jgi:hypothetical protein
VSKANELIKILSEAKLSGTKEHAKLKKKVDLVNKWIAYHKEHNVYALEPDSTFENQYEFESVKLNKDNIAVTYRELDLRTWKWKTTTDTEYFEDDEDYDLEEIYWKLKWVIRSIKRGLKRERVAIPNIK